MRRKEKEKMQQETETVDAFPAELLATVGHEFRGPLTTIQGYATTLLRHEQQLMPEERQDFLRAINEASAHLGKLVDRFLELAQFETHAHVFLPTPVSLPGLVQESITAAPKSRLHHVLLTPPVQRYTLAEGTHTAAAREELTLSGDRRLLRTMLDILLENAMTYSAPESLIEVSIEAIDAASTLTALQTPTGSDKHQALIVSTPFQEQERLLALRVRDHGIGIEPAHLALIFRRFYRVDTSLTREANGLGLGLALCKAIVTLHRGTLWVESAVGEGSTFSIVLPCEMFPVASV